MPPTQPPRTALITGASRGIGAEIARAVAATGAHTILAARSQSGCDEVAARIHGSGGHARTYALDVTDRASVAALADELESGVDWLINNAGIAESGPLLARPGCEEEHEELFRRHHEVNFHGSRALTEAFVFGMRTRRYGRVVNVASSAALYGQAYIAAYGSSKFALLGYTLCAADELDGSGVTFNAVCPHYVDSPMLEAAVTRLVEKTGRTEEQARAFFRSQNPGGRIVTQEEVAASVVELLLGGENGMVVELDGSPTPRPRHPNENRTES
jgi:NAD(P)-dependent dehydrogenase (short-subunit alcohol dehydrogenase family)